MNDALAAGGTVVLDTNIVLDLLLFEDPATHSLRAALESATLDWIATTAMREELARVLTYPHIQAWATRHGRALDAVLTGFDAHSRCVPEAAPAPMRCSDPDDQKFIDLAVAHQARLLSKDHAVRRLQSALLQNGVALQ